MHGPTRHPLILAMALVGLLPHSGHSVLVDIPERQQNRHVLVGGRAAPSSDDGPNNGSLGGLPA